MLQVEPSDEAIASILTGDYVISYCNPFLWDEGMLNDSIIKMMHSNPEKFLGHYISWTAYKDQPNLNKGDVFFNSGDQSIYMVVDTVRTSIGVEGKQRYVYVLTRLVEGSLDD